MPRRDGFSKAESAHTANTRTHDCARTLLQKKKKTKPPTTTTARPAHKKMSRNENSRILKFQKTRFYLCAWSFAVFVRSRSRLKLFLHAVTRCRYVRKTVGLCWCLWSLFHAVVFVRPFKYHAHIIYYCYYQLIYLAIHSLHFISIRKYFQKCHNNKNTQRCEMLPSHWPGRLIACDRSVSVCAWVRIFLRVRVRFWIIINIRSFSTSNEATDRSNNNTEKSIPTKFGSCALREFLIDYIMSIERLERLKLN